MRMQLMWLEDVMNAYQGEARAIVYYSGHGMPSEDAKHAYLLPVDGNSRLAASGLSTELLYNQLGKLPSRGTIVLLDACFSGARRDGKMLASNRGVAIKVKDELVTGNMVVFSAAQGDETAYPYEEMKHGLFTYFLLSTIKEKGGAISLGDLSDQVTKMVTRTSIVENDKRQTPTIHSSSVSPNWRNWMLASNAARRKGNIVTPQQTTMPVPDSHVTSHSVTTSPSPIPNDEKSNMVVATNTSSIDTNVVEKKNIKVKGYRVQVYEGDNSKTSRQDAERIGREMKEAFPTLPVYVHFYSPKWVCRVGDFRKYEEAHEIMKQLRGLGYQSVKVMKGMIKIAEE